MIQRIQTIYLLLAAIMALLAFFFPVAWFYGDANVIQLFAYSAVDHVKDNAPLMQQAGFIPSLIIAVLLVLLPVLIIFLYKKMQMQLKWLNLVILLAVIQVALHFFYYVPAFSKASGAEASYSFGVFVPLLVIVFLLLARMGIRKDIRLLRSVDRIR